MSPELWQRVEEILTAALSHSAADRAAFLDHACGGDQELRCEVELLLASAAAARNFLERPALSRPSPPRPKLSEESRIGAYRILRRLGSGGMGVVYLAARADREYEQRVAIKLLKEELAERHRARRFRHERQILARLDHPNIARLMDGGTAGDGLPYFVMEYIAGQPIDRYCDQQGLDTRQRLELFRKVCSVVHFLHQNLVLHRDLKPSNILVKSDGEPKLLDFGIAKLLGPQPWVPSTLTAAAPLPMTVDYASPEQVRGEALTTASDVYTLGVLLYELLTGHGPYRAAPTLMEKLKLICQQEPEPPSRAVKRPSPFSGDEGSTVNGVDLAAKPADRARREASTVPERHLSGDLDRIVLKALEKEPRRRYASAEQLNEDLRRYLEGWPVLARKPTAVYQAWKFVCRNRSAVAAACAGLLIFGGFSINMKILRDQTERERHRAEVVADVLTDLFESPNPKRSKGEELTARQLLDAGAGTIEEELADDPEARAALLGAMGTSYLGLGFYDQAESLLEKSLAARRAADVGPEKLTISLLNLAHLRQVQGRFGASEELFREARRLLSQRRVPDAQLARAVNSLAGVLDDQGELARAEVLYREALEMRIRLFGKEHAEVANSFNNLAACLYARGEYEQAAAFCRQSLELRIRLRGRVSAEVATAMNTCAVVLEAKGDLAAAEPLLRESLEIRRQVYAPGHPKIATGLNNLAHLLRLQGRLSEAERGFDEALEIFRRRHGPEHLSFGWVLKNQAELLVATGRAAEAEVTVRRAREILRRALPEDHWQVAVAQSVLGECLMELGRLEEAAPLLRESYLTLRDKKGERPRETREAFERLQRCQGTDRG